MITVQESVLATTIAERIRATVESGPVDLDDGELHITVSIGAAEFEPDGTSIEAVIGAADDRLYRAKAQGRNSACGAPADHCDREAADLDVPTWTLTRCGDEVQDSNARCSGHSTIGSLTNSNVSSWPGA